MNLLTTLTKPRNFFLFVLGFSLFGLVLIFNASVAESMSTFGHPWHYARYQAIWILIGMVAMTVCSYLPPQLWKQLSPILFVGAVGLLILVLIPGIGTETLGAQRRIFLGPVNIQPSEITKLAIIVYLASWLEKHQRFAPFLLQTGLIFFLIMLQPNLSTAFIVAALATVVYFLSGANLKPLILFGTIGALLVGALILSAPYRRERLQTFLQPASDPLGKSYHIRQITLALGRGGLIGQGIGLSKQKQHYIPEVTTDSIFAIHAEETGFVGSVSLISAYGILLAAGYHLARRQAEQKRLFTFLLAAGITTWIALHVLLNLAAMVALVPLTGIPLPLISYGGSSYVSLMIGLGLLLSIMRFDQEPHQTKTRRRVVRSRTKR